MMGQRSCLLMYIITTLTVLALVATTSAQSCLNATQCFDKNPYTADLCIIGNCVNPCRDGDVYNGTCVKRCEDTEIRERGTCVRLFPECGENCLKCAAENSLCAECTSAFVVDEGVCVGSCGTGKSVNSDRICEGGEESPSGGLSDTVKIALIGGGAGIGFLVIVVVMYICIDKQRNETFDVTAMPAEPRTRGQYGEDMELTSVTERDVVLNLDGGGGGGGESEEISTDGPGKLATIAWDGDGGPGESSDTPSNRASVLADATVEESNVDDVATKPKRKKKKKTFIDNTPTTELSEEEAVQVFKRLRKLKKDRETFLIILDEMKRRQAQKKSAAHRQKYDHIINDLTRLILLFKQKKTNHVFPQDVGQLMDWSKLTLDRFVGQQAVRESRQQQQQSASSKPGQTAASLY